MTHQWVTAASMPVAAAAGFICQGSIRACRFWSKPVLKSGLPGGEQPCNPLKHNLCPFQSGLNKNRQAVRLPALL
jgi:hypothetical protein